jgi:hypothetical protein
MPLVRGGATFAGLGNVPPSDQTIPYSGDNNNANLIQEGIDYAKQLYENWTAGGTRDAIRENRAKTFMGLACAGSVLAAQVCLAGPDNVASNEDPYWQAAQAGIQSQRPDVWAAAVAAGPYWPVGAQFDAIPLRVSIGQTLANSGIIVNQSALNQPFTTTFVPVTVTVKPGTTVPPGTPPGQIPPVVVPTTPPSTTPLSAGFSSPIVLLGLVGAVVWYALSKKKGGGLPL